MIRDKIAALAVLSVVILFIADVRAQRFDGFRAPPAAAEPEPPSLEPGTLRDARISLTLSDGTRLVGKPSDLEELEFKTEYGELKIPIEKIDGLRFSDYPTGGGECACGVHFTNGDVFSARLQLKSIKLETLIGEVDVECGHLRSMVMSADAKIWARVGDTWKLIPAGGVMPGATYSSPYASTTTYAPAPDGSYSTYSTPVLSAPVGPSLAPVPAYAPTLAPEADSAPRPLAPPMAR